MQSKITELQTSPFIVSVVVNNRPVVTDYNSEYEVLIACKIAAQTALFGGNRNAQVVVFAKAGPKFWRWDQSNGNILKGVNGGARDWTIFKSFVTTPVVLQA